MLDVKESRRLTEQRSGGFLLGSDAAGYLRQLERGNVWVLDEGGGHIAGFATTLGPAAFRASPLFALAGDVNWSADVSAVLSEPVGYFDQLAVRCGVSARAAARLAFVALWDVFAHDARHVVSTTVVEPIRNLAAVSFIERVGGRAVGHVAETYPQMDHLVSAVWLFTFDEMYRRASKDCATGRFLSATARTYF